MFLDQTNAMVLMCSLLSTSTRFEVARERYFRKKLSFFGLMTVVNSVIDLRSNLVVNATGTCHVLPTDFSDLP